MSESLKFVVAGHVDHGKSTLIGRILLDTNSLPDETLRELRESPNSSGDKVPLAHLLDQLKEEREKGITIDTTQTFFRTGKRDYVIIDAPGHKQFLRNMITGASQAEAALLIVAADEGVRDQTQRHAYVLQMLGLQQILVVVNKMDLVDYAREVFEKVSEGVAGVLQRLGAEAAFLVPVSAMHADNVVTKSSRMPWYKGPTVLEALDRFKGLQSPWDKPLHFPVQDVYEIDSKRILVGRVESGRIELGQKLRFWPCGKESHVKTIEVFGKNPAQAAPGESIGITLDDSSGIGRGEIACSGDYAPVVTDRFRGNIFWLAERPFEVREEVLLRCATQEVPCRIARIEKRIESASLELLEENATRLHTAEVGQVVIETKKPIVLETFYDVQELGRFVLARGHETSAGGIVTHSRDVRIVSKAL